MNQKKAKPVPESAWVDINHASKEEWMKLPGMTEAYAAKLIAGRPYKTKAHLVTHDILPFALYDALKGRIIAKQ
jgi:DNA uptake protein ComE-like DNA-binding protein